MCIHMCTHSSYTRPHAQNNPALSVYTELRVNLRMLGREARFQQCVCLAALFSALLALWQAFLV